MRRKIAAAKAMKLVSMKNVKNRERVCFIFYKLIMFCCVQAVLRDRVKHANNIGMYYELRGGGGRSRKVNNHRNRQHVNTRIEHKQFFSVADSHL
jgi:hypothetical protein